MNTVNRYLCDLQLLHEPSSAVQYASITWASVHTHTVSTGESVRIDCVSRVCSLDNVRVYLTNRVNTASKNCERTACVCRAISSHLKQLRLCVRVRSPCTKLPTYDPRAHNRKMNHFFSAVGLLCRVNATRHTTTASTHAQ
jgi:hypothetical protein